MHLCASCRLVVQHHHVCCLLDAQRISGRLHASMNTLCKGPIRKTHSHAHFSKDMVL